jgi:hypothetical protein
MPKEFGIPGLKHFGIIKHYCKYRKMYGHGELEKDSAHFFAMDVDN